jgi:large conductance mechanosensitive channel
MGLGKEFKEFAMKGSVIDLAVGVVIGAAFGKIVGSLVDDVITPMILTPILEAAHLSNIQDLKWGAVKYGNFLSAVITFILVAFVLFLIIKGVNNMKKREAAAPTVTPVPSREEELLTQIRDLLKK